MKGRGSASLSFPDDSPGFSDDTAIILTSFLRSGWDITVVPVTERRNQGRRSLSEKGPTSKIFRVK